MGTKRTSRVASIVRSGRAQAGRQAVYHGGREKGEMAMNPADAVKRAAFNKAIDYLMADPERNLPKVLETIDKHAPADLFPSQRQAFANAVATKNNWYQLLLKVAHLNPEVIGDLVKTFVVDANLLAWPVQEKMREKYGCNIPWAILLDPTSACNLRCKGCWAADYGHKLNLTYEDIDSIIEQGKALGTHVYIYTGGEPLVRKDDVIRLCEKHRDCAFLCFTNATLIDEKFCQEMIRVKNFIPAISAEGFEETTDARRGAGTYARIQKAMALLREQGLPFGISACFTSQNASSVVSEEYFDWMIEQGALFCWIFTYMPVGTDAPTDLMATARQRADLYRFVRAMRKVKPLFTLDFWNDGEYVGGCIAGGRRYLHINARGDVEPCVFFDGNYLRPCPILDNPYRLEELVDKSGAYSTDLVHEESAHDLCAKCADAALAWYPVAHELWNDPNDEAAKSRANHDMGMGDYDLHKFARLGRDPREQHVPSASAEGACGQSAGGQGAGGQEA